MKPPPLPSEVLRRVLAVARFDGISVLAVAGACALISAAAHDTTGAVVGVIVAGAGAIELHGTALLRHGDERGMRWLVASQLFLMAAIMGYVAFRFANPDLATFQKVITPEISDQIQQAGMTVDQFIRGMLHMIYFAVAAATFLYQGGMSVYYLRRRAAVAQALREDEA